MPDQILELLSGGTRWTAQTASAGTTLFKVTAASQLTLIHDSTNGGAAGGVTISDVTTAYGPAIQIAVVGAGTGDWGAAIAITDAGLVLPTGAGGSLSYTIQYRVRVTAGTFLGSFGAGFCMSRLAGANAFGVGALAAAGFAGSRPSRVQAGTWKGNSGTTPTGPAMTVGGAIYTVVTTVESVPAPSALTPPGFMVGSQVIPSGVSNQGGQFLADSAAYSGGGYLGAFAGWDTPALSTCGLMLGTNGEVAPAYTLVVDKIAVLSL